MAYESHEYPAIQVNTGSITGSLAGCSLIFVYTAYMSPTAPDKRTVAGMGSS